MPKRKIRTSVPGVAELLRPTVPLLETSDERQVTGRERHDQKITVYLSAAELLDLEHARLKLRRFGFVMDRGRLVREAIAILLADLDARGAGSLIVRRVGARPGPDAGDVGAVDDVGAADVAASKDDVAAGKDDVTASKDKDGDAVPSLGWALLQVAR